MFILIQRGLQAFILQWLNDVVAAEIIYQQPMDMDNGEHDDITGSRIRQHLTDYLSTNCPLRKSVLR